MKDVTAVISDINALEYELRNKQLPSNWSTEGLETFIMAVDDLLETANKLFDRVG